MSAATDSAVGSFAEGVSRFNAQLFWEAHEAWEAIWLEASPEVAPFLQGLIQLAAAWHHVARGNVRGAARLFEAALDRLRPFPVNFCGVPREALTAKAALHRAWALDAATRLSTERRTDERIGNDWPQIALSADWRERCLRDLAMVNRE